MGRGRHSVGTCAPFKAGLPSNLASEVMNNSVPVAHLCGIEGIWSCNVKPEDSFGAWKKVDADNILSVVFGRKMAPTGS